MFRQINQSTAKRVYVGDPLSLTSPPFLLQRRQRRDQLDVAVCGGVGDGGLAPVPSPSSSAAADVPVPDLEKIRKLI